MDRTLIEAWASHKSFRRKNWSRDQDRPSGQNPDAGIRGERRRNDTHESTTDPQPRLVPKSKGVAAEPCFAGYSLMEDRFGLVVDAYVTTATGTALQEVALEMIAGVAGAKPITADADKGYGNASVVGAPRCLVRTSSLRTGASLKSRRNSRSGPGDTARSCGPTNCEESIDRLLAGVGTVLPTS